MIGGLEQSCLTESGAWKGRLTSQALRAADGTQQASLDLQGNGTMPFLGTDITPLALTVENVDQNILRVKIGANGRFEVPHDLFQNTGQGELPPYQSPVFLKVAPARPRGCSLHQCDCMST